MEHARMIAAQRQAKDDEIVRLRERCRILELSKAEYDDLHDVKDNELAAQDDEIERLQRENEELRKQCDTLEFRAGDALDRAVRAEQELAALLGSLGDWVYERMQQADSDYHNYGDDTAEVYATLKMVLSKIESMMIESLPLIGEK